MLQAFLAVNALGVYGKQNNDLARSFLFSFFFCCHEFFVLVTLWMMKMTKDKQTLEYKMRPEDIDDLKKMHSLSDCQIRGCRNLEWRCADCGRIANMASVPDYPRWISVKKRLPEETEDVLVWCELDVYIGFYHSTSGWWRQNIDEDISCTLKNVTHWMPLPSTESIEDT